MSLVYTACILSRGAQDENIKCVHEVHWKSIVQFLALFSSRFRTLKLWKTKRILNFVKSEREREKERKRKREREREKERARARESERERERREREGEREYSQPKVSRRRVTRPPIR